LCLKLAIFQEFNATWTRLLLASALRVLVFLFPVRAYATTLWIPARFWPINHMQRPTGVKAERRKKKEMIPKLRNFTVNADNVFSTSPRTPRLFPIRACLLSLSTSNDTPIASQRPSTHPLILLASVAPTKRKNPLLHPRIAHHPLTPRVTFSIARQRGRLESAAVDEPSNCARPRPLGR
jgi:hypothetical protein